MKYKKPFKKAAIFTDIHWGRKNNSEVHNQDCANFIEWFCANVKNDPDVDCIMFLGDWHEHRAAINGLTLKYSYAGARSLNELGLPVFFVIGNHDLYNRHNRDVYTTNPFDSLENFVLVNDEPLVLEGNKAVMFPYLFEAEYHTLLPKYLKNELFFGHFEFEGFVVTGESRVHDHGPKHDTLKTLKRVFSGHFHKRQEKDNVVYIGNAFPADFSDANDFKRGMATYEFESDTLEFTDWVDCPKYIKTTLTAIIQKPKSMLLPNARVKCDVDIELNYEESVELREKLMKKYKLRELTLEESTDHSELLEGTGIETEGLELESTSNIIKELLRQIKGEKVRPEMLVKIYEEL